MIRFTLSYRSVESLNFKLNSNRNGHFLSLQVRWCFCCCASSCSPPPFILSLDYGRIFFPSWNWTLKGNSWKLTFKRKWMDSQHRHLKVFCTAIASSEINCGTCIYPCCVLYLFCSTSPFSHFVQYIFGFLWQIFCVSSFTPPGLHSVHQSVTSTRCIYSWTGAFSFLWADVLLFVCFGVFFVTV